MRQISRLSRVAGVDRHMLAARDPARRVEQEARRLSGSRRDRRAARPPPPARRAPALPKPSSVATPKRAFSARSPARLSNPPLPAPVRNAGHRRVGDGLGRRQPRQLGGQLARPAGDQLEPPGRDVGGGDAPFVARPADRRQPVGRRRTRATPPRSACPASPAGRSRARPAPSTRAPCAPRPGFRSARRWRRGGRRGSAGRDRLRRRGPARRTSGSARRRRRRAWSARCRGSRAAALASSKNSSKKSPIR